MKSFEFLRKESMNSVDRIPSGQRDMVMAHGRPDSTDVPLFTGQDPTAPQVKKEIEILKQVARQRLVKILESGRPIGWEDICHHLPDGMGTSTDLVK